MKFKQFLAEDQGSEALRSAAEFLLNFDLKFGFHDYKDLDEVLAKLTYDANSRSVTFGGAAQSNSGNVVLSLYSKEPQTFKWQLESDQPNLDLSLAGHNDGCLIIESFEDLPNAKQIAMLYPTIKSFRGIDKLTNLKEFQADLVRLGSGCPLLSLLKCQKDVLIYIDVSTPVDAYEAMEIVNRHLKGDRNIADCQEDLIDAGLEEFAKL